MTPENALKALDKCLNEAWACRYHLDNLLDADEPTNREIEGMNACLCIDNICKLWSKVSQIPNHFLTAVAKDNSSRFPTQYRPCFDDHYYPSWHHYAIITIRCGVQEFKRIADDKIIFDVTKIMEEFDLSKIKLVSRNIDHKTNDEIEFMRDSFPNYSMCRVGLDSERDNQKVEASDEFNLRRPIVLTTVQRAIIKALKGKALTKQMLLDGPCQSMNGKTFADAMRGLESFGQVKNDRKIGGYYRPDSPPLAD